MSAFIIGVCSAVLIALVAGVGLGFADRSTADAFYTKYTVPPDYRTPSGGRLDHAAREQQH